MEIHHDVALERFNTLALPARAEHLCVVGSDDELDDVLAHARHQRWPVTPVGGGSNLVVAGDVPGLVVVLRTTGVAIEAQADDSITLGIAAGEDWPRLVEHTLASGWYGLENLSLIPGTAGAAPIQNIGAYGVELDRRFVSLAATHLATGEKKTFSARDCEFGYRDSVFKRREQGQWVITTLHLTLSHTPAVCLDYPELQRALDNIDKPSPLDVHHAVCRSRRGKLPDPAREPNAGSFFKNPVIPRPRADALQARYPDLPRYDLDSDWSKIPAAWLIDRAGWKGQRRGAFAVHDRQALVLIHRGGGTGPELLAFAGEIAADVAARFGVELEMEPRLLGVEDHSGNVTVR